MSAIEDEQREAREWLSRTAEFAGDMASGVRALVRMDSAYAAAIVLRQRMAPEVRDELGQMLVAETAARAARKARAA